jgi:hypothetical protein
MVALLELGAVFCACLVPASARLAVIPNVIRAAVAPPLASLTAIAAIGFISISSCLTQPLVGLGTSS